jgi:hypothetical protein
VTSLPRGLRSAFHVAVSELGMCTAAWLFVEEVAAEGGRSLVSELRRELGADWPVLDAVAAMHLEGRQRPDPDVRRLGPILEGAAQLVCVGLEAAWLDALVAETSTPVAVVRHSVFDPDWERVAANYGDRVTFEGLGTFQRLAGPRTVLLTYAYGADDVTTHVLPAWVRVSGEDVRTQFRDLVAWEVLHHPFETWPRWLVGVPTRQFTSVVR